MEDSPSYTSGQGDLSMMINERTALLVFAFLIVAGAYSVLPSQSKIAGSHSMYRISSTPSAGDSNFCAKCHPDIAGNISSNHTDKAHGAFAGCICHGYYPNYTSITGPNGLNYNYTINLKHNLTKNIYCTNCHTRYNSSGGIELGNNRSGVNQSGHYVYLNKSNKTEIYDRVFTYFNQSPFGPL